MHICVGGLTASGKSTLARYLARKHGLRRVRASDLLLGSVARASSKKKRLLHWAEADERTLQRSIRRSDRRVDSAVLSMLRRSRQALVVEALTLPILAGMENALLCVWLAAPESIRAARLQRALRVSRGDALRIVRRKDARTRGALLDAWGFDVMSTGFLAHYDLVVEQLTRDDSRGHIEDIASAAVAAYEGLCSARISARARRGVQELVVLARRPPPGLKLQIVPALLRPPTRSNAERWRKRRERQFQS